jgi:hydroxymethylpyrimidine pyrophosphatase-like HAD family hydrolase
METKPFLIALDLDGTLLKDDKTISNYSKQMDILSVLLQEDHFDQAPSIMRN